MSTIDSEDTRVDLNEVLTSIEDAMRTTYKDSNGRAYAPVSTGRLRRWMVALAAATQHESDKHLLEAYNAAKASVTQLMEAAEAREELVARLKKEIEAKEMAYKQVKTKQTAVIDDLTKQRDAAQASLQEASEAKVASVKALQSAEAKLKSVEAKYDPDTSKDLATAARGLRQDIADAQDMIASSKATISKLNVELDTERKKVAAKDHELRSAKAELSEFTKKLDAAKHSNFDLFKKEDLNRQELELALGPKAFAKLLEVLAIEPWDVRGRVQRLQGYFSVFSRATRSKFTAMIALLKEALDLLRDRSFKWSVILAPWVNSIIKDIVTFELKSVKTYRLELETRVKALGDVPSGASFLEHKKASPQDSRESWAKVAKDRVNATNSLLVRFTQRAAERWAALKKIAGHWTSAVARTNAKIWRGLRIGAKASMLQTIKGFKYAGRKVEMAILRMSAWFWWPPTSPTDDIIENVADLEGDVLFEAGPLKVD